MLLELRVEDFTILLRESSLKGELGDDIDLKGWRSDETVEFDF
jgi:hypothetical protein